MLHGQPVDTLPLQKDHALSKYIGGRFRNRDASMPHEIHDMWGAATGCWPAVWGTKPAAKSAL